MTRPPRHARLVAGLGTVTLLLLAACADEPPETPQSPPVTITTTPPAATTTATSPSTSTPSPGGTASATETDTPADSAWSLAEQMENFPSGGGELLPVGVRTGEHPEYDRVVFDLDGTGEPGWRVTYVDQAIEDPKGDLVELEGDAVSEVIITGLRMPEESEFDSVLSAGAFEVDDLEEVEEIHVSGLFEGQLQVFVGLDDEVPFRVFVLQDPVRLVVDYQTS